MTVADGAANDGATGEGDNVQPDIEIVYGGSSDDRLSGPDGGGELWGRAGNDQLFGGNSDDLLEGEDGDDRLEGGYRGDALNGGTGVDTVDYSWHSVTDTSTGEVFGVSSTPNGVADDGNFTVDEGNAGTDNVGADVENVLGSDGPRLPRGNARHQPPARRGTQRQPRRQGRRRRPRRGYGRATRSTAARARTCCAAATRPTPSSGNAGDDTMDGGTGGDIAQRSGGIDTITYAGRAVAVATTLDELRNDGADPNGNGISTGAEEGDLDRSVENVTGGDAGDILRAPDANAIVNVLRGGIGNDTLSVREGTATLDSLFCGPGTDSFAKDPADLQNLCETALP